MAVGPGTRPQQGQGDIQQGTTLSNSSEGCKTRSVSDSDTVIDAWESSVAPFKVPHLSKKL